jgi:hypothetical protein
MAPDVAEFATTFNRFTEVVLRQADRGGELT